jgi:aarF domain-containing kinase
MKHELADETKYTREAHFLNLFNSSKFLGTDVRYKVPWVWEGSTDEVLVMERVGGRSVGGSTVDRLTQEDRNYVGLVSYHAQ